MPNRIDSKSNNSTISVKKPNTISIADTPKQSLLSVDKVVELSERLSLEHRKVFEELAK